MVKILTSLSLGPDDREEDLHGTKDFPCEIYKTSLQKHRKGRIPEHWHGEVEIGYVEKGCVAFSCNNKKYTLHEDDTYFISSAHRHAMTDLSEASVFFSIVFHEKMIAGPGSIND